MLKLPHMYPRPSNWSWNRIDLDLQMRCQVEPNSWVPLWYDTLPFLMYESTFFKTPLGLVYMTSQLDSDWAMNLDLPWEIF